MQEVEAKCESHQWGRYNREGHWRLADGMFAISPGNPLSHEPFALDSKIRGAQLCWCLSAGMIDV